MWLQSNQSYISYGQKVHYQYEFSLYFVNIGKFEFRLPSLIPNQNANRHFQSKLTTDFAEMQHKTKYEDKL